MSDKLPYTYYALCRYHGEDVRNVKDGDFLLRQPKLGKYHDTYNVFRHGKWSQNRYHVPLKSEVKKIPVEHTPKIFWPNVRSGMLVIMRDEILYEIGHVLPLGTATRITIKRTLAYRPGKQQWLWGWSNKGVWTRLGNEMDTSPQFPTLFDLPEIWQQRAFEASLREE